MGDLFEGRGVYYFAARYSRHAEMRGCRAQLLAAIPGASVSSRWIDQHGGDLPEAFSADALNTDAYGCWPFGQADLEDLASSAAIVSFTGSGGRGGRHVEHGVAIAYADNSPMLGLGQFRLIVVGPREHIFHCHPATEAFPDFDTFLAAEVRRLALGEVPGV